MNSPGKSAGRRHWDSDVGRDGLDQGRSWQLDPALIFERPRVRVPKKAHIPRDKYLRVLS